MSALYYYLLETRAGRMRWSAVALMLCAPLLVTGADLLADALVAEERNCTLANQTFGLTRMCKRDVVERLFLYVAVQQLYVARRREQHEDDARREVEEGKRAKEKVEEANLKGAYNFFAILFFFFIVWVCVSSILPRE